MSEWRNTFRYVRATGGSDLSASLGELRKWKARHALKMGVHSVVAANRLANIKNLSGKSPSVPKRTTTDQGSIGSPLDGVVVEGRSFRDDFLLGKKLGSGAFSIVRRAVSKLDKKEYAVKCIRKKGLKPKEVEALESEIKILSTLHHPHILSFVSVYK